MDIDARDFFAIPTIITPDNFDDPEEFDRLVENALAVDCLMSGDISIADFMDYVEATTGQSEEFLDLVGMRLKSAHNGDGIPL